MEAFAHRQDAILAKEKSNAFSCLFNKVESDGYRHFFTVQSEDTIVDLMKQSIERHNILHYHEILGEITKIFFDLDLKVSLAALKHPDVNQFCSDRLSDNGEDYASLHRKYYQYATEQYIVYVVKSVVAQEYADAFAAEFATRSIQVPSSAFDDIQLVAK